MKTNTLMAHCAAGVILAGASVAQADGFTDGLYIGVGYGIFDMDNISTNGQFTSDFTTGTTSEINPPLTIPAGESIFWNTEMGSGDGLNFVIGRQVLDRFRVEFEYSAVSNDVDGHDGVTAAGISLDGLDAGVLLTGNVGDLGITVGDLVADGRGEVETSTFFMNGYYDFKNSTGFTPFVGAGVGYSNVEVEYKPSDVGIVDDDDNVFAWQIMAGVSYSLSDQLHVVGSLRYRDTEGAELGSGLLPAEFDIETETLSYDIGFRYDF